MILDTIHKLPRNSKKYIVYDLLTRSSELDLIDTITSCFFIRDPRKGRGERDLGRLCFNWIADIHPTLFLKVFHLIPNYGRWDDLLYIQNSKIVPYVLKFLALQIDRDWMNMSIGLPITTCCKWLPSEGKSFARHYKQVFQRLMFTMNTTPKEYRVRLKSLRSYLSQSKHIQLCEGTIYKLHRKEELRVTFVNPCSIDKHEGIQKTYSSRKKNDDDYEDVKSHLKLYDV